MLYKKYHRNFIKRLDKFNNGLLSQNLVVVCNGVLVTTNCGTKVIISRLGKIVRRIEILWPSDYVI